ncbi:16S rRNA (guanine(527)-N(7))-methyltransferase RsmG [bacterium]|nr:16S rRNA (guanine(527)-N(7))-methyltransferase RsmG [bacterium]
MHADWLEFKKYIEKNEMDLPGYVVDGWYEYFSLLLETNKTMNLTRIVEHKDALLKHFLDTYSLHTFLESRNIVDELDSFLDFGTGGGIPGIPLKILWGDPHLYLVDARNKKLKFLEDVCYEMSISGVTYVHENWDKYNSKIWSKKHGIKPELVVSRAVGNSVKLVETLAPITQKYILLPRGPELLPNEFSMCRKAANKKSFSKAINKNFKISYEGQEIERNLFFFEKR